MVEGGEARNHEVIIGWLWEGTEKWWPAMFGDPPPIRGARWIPIRRKASDV